MFKKTLIVLAALSSSTPTIAKEAFSGRIVTAGKIIAPRVSASSAVTYGCNDHDLGYFDLCVDVILVTQEKITRFNINPNINPAMGNQRQNMLVRYAIKAGNYAPDFPIVFVNSKLSNTHTAKGVTIGDGAFTVFYQTSQNGGQSWNDFRWSTRPLL